MGWEWVRKGVGVTPSGPVKANRGFRAHVAAAGKALEGDDQQIYLHYITIVATVDSLCLWNEFKSKIVRHCDR